MATRTAVVNRAVSPRGGVIQAVWSGLLNGDSGDWLSFAEYSDKTIQVTGTFGAGGSVSLQGSNDVTPVNASTMKDRQGVAMTLTAAGMATAQDKPLWVRPIVTAGDGTTSLAVAVVMHRVDIAEKTA